MSTRILCVGDAITRGTNRDGSGALPSTITSYSWRRWLWTALREKGRDVDFVGPHTWPDFENVEFDQGNCAFGGNTTIAWMLDKVRALRVADAAAKAKGEATIAPQVALVLIGTEDAYKQTTIADRKAGILSLVTELRGWYADHYATGALQVVLSTLPPTTDGENGAYRDRTQIQPFNLALAELVTTLTKPESQVLLVDPHDGWTAAMSDSTGRKPNEAGDKHISSQFFAAVEPLLGGVGPVIPTPDPETGEEPNYSVGSIRAEFVTAPASVVAGAAVTFTDRSVADRKKMHRRVVIIDGIDPGYVRDMIKYVPDDIFKLTIDPTTPVEGVDWAMQEHATERGPILIPYPLTNDTVLVSDRAHAGADWTGVGAISCYPPVLGKVSLPLIADEVAKGLYPEHGQTLLHELLHTIEGLESSDDLYFSEGFLAWLEAHPSDLATAFLRNPAAMETTYELLSFFYYYLIETYRTTPELWSRQVTYFWSFGDGATSTERSPVHTYAAAGAYPVHLTVTTREGFDTSDLVTITVAAPTAPPVAAFRASASAGEAPFGVQFYDESTGGTPDTWRYEFGDGAESSAATRNPTHVYTSPGVYSPRLTVTNGAGTSTVEHEHAITVLRPPAAPPAIHELEYAGFVDLLEMVAEMFGYIELRDEGGKALAPRIPTAGRITATLEEDTLNLVLQVRILGADLAALPQKISGGEFYENAVGGERLARAIFEDMPIWPVLNASVDALDITIPISVVAESVLPRITNLSLQNVTGVTGAALVASFRVQNPPPGAVVVLSEYSPVVPVGGQARLSLKVVRS